MNKREKDELAKMGVLTGKDARKFSKAIKNPKPVSQEELARIRKGAKRINDIPGKW